MVPIRDSCHFVVTLLLAIVFIVSEITCQLINSTTNHRDIRSTVQCKDLGPISGHLSCNYNTSCVYGQPTTVECHVVDEVECDGPHTFEATFTCLYCWQLPEDHYTCRQNTSCKPHTRYLTTCSTNSTLYCLGHRVFSRYKQCNAVTGHKWSMALVLSVLFGGFGVDRFYLGHWQEGMGKLFSFGGFGVWTLIDTILIAIGYLKPADSSHYEL